MKNKKIYLAKIWPKNVLKRFVGIPQYFKNIQIKVFYSNLNK